MAERFEPATCDHGTWRQHLAAIKAAGGTKEAAQSSWGYLKRCEYFRSDTYQVAVDKTPSHGFGDEVELWHLSFKRNDREAFHDWRVAQWIKNEICGPECEGMEIYPAESRKVDTSNQYHLWVFMNPDYRFPCGWGERLVLDSDEDGTRQGVFSVLAPEAKQRPLDNSQGTTDMDKNLDQRIGPADSWIRWDAPGHDPEIELWLTARGFIDSTWHNDVCPSFHNEVKGLRLWIYELDMAAREGADGARFELHQWNGDEFELVIGAAEEWAVMRELVITAMGAPH